MGKEVPQMVRGLGMAMRLISSLNDELKERGGHEEMLHFLTTESGRDNLRKVADLIVSLQWRVPKSVVMKLAREWSIAEYGGAHVSTDEYFFWEPTLQKLGIPYTRFVDPQQVSAESYSLDELREQLEGKTATAGMPVGWKGAEYLVTSLGYGSGDPMLGDTIEMDRLEFVHLTPINYIDPDR